MSTSEAAGKKLAHTIHHTNIPVTDFDRTEEWYTQVFGLKKFNIAKFVKTPTTMILTNGNFDIHFELYPSVDIPKSTFEHRTGANLYHFCIEVEDWDEFNAHLDELGIERHDIKERPQNKSKSADIFDPDGHQIEIAYHAERDY